MQERKDPVHVRLNVLLETRDHARHLQADPVSFVHRFSKPRDVEIVGLLASSLAFGNVVAVRKSVARVLALLGDSPSSTLDGMSENELRRLLKDFVHRVYRGNDVARLLTNAASLQREHKTLGAYVKKIFLAHDEDLRETLAQVAHALRGKAPSRGLQHLMPDPHAGSACKRLLLYFRWMVRDADGVDLGMWTLPAAALVIPVDTHILRISQNLRLTNRKDASWRTASEITEALKRFDPSDPVRYDFALCHLGVSRDCPSRRDDTLCAQCTLKSVCRHWTRKPRRVARPVPTRAKSAH